MALRLNNAKPLRLKFELDEVFLNERDWVRLTVRQRQFVLELCEKYLENRNGLTSADGGIRALANNLVWMLRKSLVET